MTDFRWGILATGTVARKFAHGLRATRDMSIAVVASRAIERAEAFAREFGVPRAFGNYQEAVEAGGVDAFYVATPPSTHRAEALRCLRAGVPVLVEKPFAVTATEAREVVEVAREEGIFCMEAMWTHFLPLVRHLKSLLEGGAIGTVRMVAGSFCGAEAFSPDNHLFSAELGGGALLDRGVYPLSLAHHLFGPPVAVQSDAVTGASNVDDQVAILLRYADGAQAVFYASLQTAAPNDFHIMGSAGRIHVHAPIFRPHRLTVSRFGPRQKPRADGSRRETIKENRFVHAVHQRFGGLMTQMLSRGTKTTHHPYAGNGYHYEAEEVMRCVQAGRHESAIMPLDQTLGVMGTVENIRRGWPAGIAQKDQGMTE